MMTADQMGDLVTADEVAMPAARARLKKNVIAVVGADVETVRVLRTCRKRQIVQGEGPAAHLRDGGTELFKVEGLRDVQSDEALFARRAQRAQDSHVTSPG